MLESRAPSRFPEFGLRLAEVTPELLKKYELEPDLKGLMIRGVEPEGLADRAGLEIGMVITDVAMVRVETLADFRAAVAKRTQGRDLVIRIRKGPKAEFRVILDRLPEGEGR